jgi:soluble lytic murein transglycosylase-like protein
MATLKAFAVAAALLAATPVRAESVADWRPYVVEASARFGVPAAWIERVMQAESAGRTMLGGRPITSHAGAMGLMQLMPPTWSEMRSAYRLGANPYDPHDNILAGTAYLRILYVRFGYPGLFAAYNAGPGRYADYLGGRQLPGETLSYLRSVAGTMVPGGQRAAVRSLDQLFAPVGRSMSARSVPDPASSPGTLFAIGPRSSLSPF